MPRRGVEGLSGKDLDAFQALERCAFKYWILDQSQAPF